MFKKAYLRNSKKRKLSYECSATNMKPGLVGHKDAGKIDSDWMKSGDGFTDLQHRDRSKPSATGKDRKPWSSIEEEDLLDIEDKMTAKNSKSTNVKRRKIGSSFTATSEADFDVNISESDSESESSVEKHVVIKTLKPCESVVDIQDIESEDSRTATTLTSQPEASGTSFQSNSWSPEISGTSTSSPASVHIQQSPESKVKASDWLRSLDLKTPTKDMQSCPSPVTEDSSKKKFKFQRGGLADQLSKLLIREKSAVRMWTHQQKTTQNLAETSKTVQVRVESFEFLYSLQLARCSLLNSDLIQTHVLCQTDGDRKESDSGRLVMFCGGASTEIQAGSIVRISAPWQELQLKGRGETVLLCTNFYQIIGTDSVNLSEDKTTFHCVRTWNCPCSSGLAKDGKSCPAYQYPCVPGVTLSVESKDGTSSSCVNPSNKEATLHLIQDSQTFAQSSVISDSLLERIEKYESSSDIGLCFRARLQRVLCKWTREKSKKSWSLLVEDGQGTVSEILLPVDEEDVRFSDVLDGGEGQTFTFSGLRVHNRTNREREAGLFSMIDRVWSGRKLGVDSQNSDDISDSLSYHQVNMEAPGFCYILREDERCTDGLKIAKSSDSVSLYHGINVVDLVDTSTEIKERISFIARVFLACKKDFLFPLQKELKLEDIQVVYITDKTLAGTDIPYKMLHITSHCLLTDLDLTGKEKNVLLFKDVLKEGNSALFCDEYSRIVRLTNNTSDDLLESLNQQNIKDFIHELSSVKLDLPELQDSCQLGKLYKVTGVIKDVDESKAYSWDTCNKCGLDKLVQRRNTQDLVCQICNVVVSDPDTKMKMEVILNNNSMGECSLKVDLLQSTIESLLPSEGADDEGYELSCVIQRDIGPLNCLLQELSKHKDKLNEIHLREVEL